MRRSFSEMPMVFEKRRQRRSSSVGGRAGLGGVKVGRWRSDERVGETRRMVWGIGKMVGGWMLETEVRSEAEVESKSWSDGW